MTNFQLISENAPPYSDKFKKSVTDIRQDGVPSFTREIYTFENLALGKKFSVFDVSRCFLKKVYISLVNEGTPSSNI